MAGTWLANGAMQTIGVLAFFLISGFLITSSVLARRMAALPNVSGAMTRMRIAVTMRGVVRSARAAPV